MNNVNSSTPQVNDAMMNYIMQRFFSDSPAAAIDPLMLQLEGLVKEAAEQRSAAQMPLIKRKFVELKISPAEVTRYTTILVNSGIISGFDSHVIYVETLFRSRSHRPWAEIERACSHMGQNLKQRIFSTALQQWPQRSIEAEYLRFLIQLNFPVNVNELTEETAELLLNLGLAPELLLNEGAWEVYNFGVIELAFRRGAPIHELLYKPYSRTASIAELAKLTVEQLRNAPPVISPLLNSYFTWKNSGVAFLISRQGILELLRQVCKYDFNRCQTSKGKPLEPLILQALRYGDNETFIYLANNQTINLNQPVPICAGIVQMIPDVLDASTGIMNLEYLVQRGGDVNLGTPLLSAIAKGNIPLVQALLRLGADCRLVDKQTNRGCWHHVFGRQVPPPQQGQQIQGNAAPYILPEPTRTALTQRLTGLKPQPSAIDFAFHEATEEDILFLIRNNLLVECVADEQDRTLLHAACARGWIECVSLLLSKNVTVNVVDKKGTSPIGLAFQNGHVQIVLSLLDKRRIDDVDIFVGPENRSLLKFLLAQRRFDLFVKVLKWGAAFAHLIFPSVDPDLREFLSQKLPDVIAFVPEEQRNNAVGYLCSPQGKIALLKVLQSLGANIAAKGKERISLLALASMTHDPALIRYIINEKGVDVNDGGSKNEAPPLVCLCGPSSVNVPPERMEECAVLLLDKGAKINQPSCKGQTVLMGAVLHFSGNYRLLRLLLTRGANVNAQDKDGGTVLRYNHRRIPDKEGLFFFLLALGANPYLKDHYHIRPLFFFCEKYNLKSPFKHILKEFQSLHARLDSAQDVKAFFAEVSNTDLVLTCPEVQQGRNPLEVLYLLRLPLGPICARMTREECRRHVLDLAKTKCPKSYNSLRRFLMKRLYSVDENYVKKGKPPVEIPQAANIDLNILVQLLDKIVFDEQKLPGHRNPRTLRDEDDLGRPVLRTPKYLRDMLARLVNFVYERKSYLGTPNPKDSPEQFKKYYDNLENILKHLTHYFAALQDLDKRKNCLIDLSLAAGKCGNRWLGEGHRQCVTFVLKQEVETFGDQVYGAFRKFRNDILISLPGAQNTHNQNALLRLIGIPESLPGATLLDVQDPTSGALNQYVEDSKPFYYPKTRSVNELEKVLSEFLKEKYKEDQDLVVDWFRDNLPEQWKAEEYRDFLQQAKEMEQQGVPRERIAQFLMKNGVLLKEIQSSVEAIRKARELACEAVKQQFVEYRTAMEQYRHAPRERIRCALEKYGIVLSEGQTVDEALDNAEESEIDQKIKIFDLYEQEVQLINTREEAARYLGYRGIYLDPIQTVERAVDVQRRQDYLDEEFWDAEAKQINFSARLHMLVTLGVIREAAHPGLFAELCQHLKKEQEAPRQQQHKRKAEKAAAREIIEID